MRHEGRGKGRIGTVSDGGGSSLSSHVCFPEADANCGHCKFILQSYSLRPCNIQNFVPSPCCSVFLAVSLSLSPLSLSLLAPSRLPPPLPPLPLPPSPSLPLSLALPLSLSLYLSLCLSLSLSLSLRLEALSLKLGRSRF